MAFVQNLNPESCPQPINTPILNMTGSAILADRIVALPFDAQPRDGILTVTSLAVANERHCGYCLEEIPNGQTGSVVTYGPITHPRDFINGINEILSVGQKFATDNSVSFRAVEEVNLPAIAELLKDNGSTANTIEVMFYGRDPRIQQIIEETDYAIVRNTGSSTIAANTFIQYDDTHNNRKEIVVSSTAAANEQFVAFVTESIPSGGGSSARGLAVVNGIITGVNTASLSVGNRVKLASSTTVELANATGDNVIGIVIVADASGTILLDGNGVDKHINATLADFGSFAWQNQQTSSSVNGHSSQTFPADTLTMASESTLEPTSNGSEIQDGEIFLTTTAGIIRFAQAGRYKIVMPEITWNLTKSTGGDSFVTSTARLIGEVNGTNRIIYENIFEDQSTLTSSSAITVTSPEKEFSAVFQAGELLRLQLFVDPTVAFTTTNVSSGLTNRFRINAGNFYYEVIQLM